LAVMQLMPASAKPQPSRPCVNVARVALDRLPTAEVAPQLDMPAFGRKWR
jgi:hypothetical protein